ncbi:type IV pili methyl-accepting chemotaxis transducer N-terminal domain-containing protein [Loktanella sp. Alg231-35]|uniref:type IV pili methyl-accepting chemotaxis transducer N-terminal domain-containing protein n=1 Tax=Loktanella sp. Alg231-35 TaxID=1922220 RepID=UPI000D560735|nr:type IV pili methyl-accepting chemotaxis transducer N-terminal domain-containing protein [Loktanella sp. Alg231-35]
MQMTYRAVALVACQLATTSYADQFSMIQESGSAERIELADELRSLTQEVASAACHLHSLVEVDRSKEQLREAIGGFDTRLIALRDGDPALGLIGAEHKPRVLRDILEIHDIWVPIMTASETLLQNPADFDAAKLIYLEIQRLFTKADDTFVHISGEYSNSVELLEADAIVLDIVGQQVVNSQRLAYDACRLGSLTADPVLTADLENTVTHFERALFALRFGQPSIGVQTAPTLEIAEHLEQAVEDWADIRAITDPMVAGEYVSLDQRARLFHLMDQKLHSMRELTHLYVEYSKRTLH